MKNVKFASISDQLINTAIILDMMFNTEMIVKDMKGGKEDMTEKRFVDYFDKDHNYIIQDLQNEEEYQVGFVNCDEDVFLKLVNELADENEELKQHNVELISKIDFLERVIDGDV